MDTKAETMAAQIEKDQEVDQNLATDIILDLSLRLHEITTVLAHKKRLTKAVRRQVPFTAVYEVEGTLVA
jgi:hypothetical protein